MDTPAKECPDRQNHCRRAKPQPAGSNDTRHPALLHHQVVYRLLKQLQPGLCFKRCAHGTAVQHPIGLRPRRAHRRSLAGIEYPKLDTGPVCGARHNAAQRIDLAHQVAFTDTANRRIATHLAERVEVVRQQQGSRTKPRRRQCGLGTGMAATYHDHIELSVTCAHTFRKSGF